MTKKPGLFSYSVMANVPLATFTSFEKVLFLLSSKYL